MTNESEGSPQPPGGDPVDHSDIRARIDRFARLRSAQRALPATAMDLESGAQREARADLVRKRLGQLARPGSSERSGAGVAVAMCAALDADLDAIEAELLDRVDAIEFPALRAAIPKAVEAHRHEVIALLESILADRDRLAGRLAKVEYVITILATEEGDGRRVIAHDPASLTPMLQAFADLELDSAEAEAFAIELYQAAALDADVENPVHLLRESRARKLAIGLGVLSPPVLRAVVTYNARMYNRVELANDCSRESDALLDQILPGLEEDLERADTRPEAPLEAKDAAPVRREEKTEPLSVFDCAGVTRVVEAVRRRLRGIPIGSCSSERVALVLDLSRLDELEREAILAEVPSRDQTIILHTALVGLMVRDLGAVANELHELGIPSAELSSHWIIELNDAIGPLVSATLARAGQYEQARVLSEIKAKHLFAPLAAIKAANRKAGIDAHGDSSAAAAETASSDGTQSWPARSKKGSRSVDAAPEAGSWPGWMPDAQVMRGAALAALLIAAVLVAVQTFMATSSTVSTLSPRDLSRTSPHLASAYRSELGRGGLLIGKLDAGFEKLSPELQREAVTEMVARFRQEGLREVMLYDGRGRLQVHFASGELRRPHLTQASRPVERTGDRPHGVDPS